MAEERSILSLSVTQEQRDFIYTSWLLNEWSLDCIENIEDYNREDGETIDESDDISSSERCQQCGAVSGSQGLGQSETDHENDNNADHENDDIDDHENMYGYRIEENADDDECPWCLCKPCITNTANRQIWWEIESHLPSVANSRLRKTHYQRFWVMLLHHGAWDKPAYKAKKKTALQNRGIHAWSGPNPKHPRDIMPDCVLTLVRGWLPNLPTQPYMGHKWS